MKAGVERETVCFREREREREREGGMLVSRMVGGLLAAVVVVVVGSILLAGVQVEGNLATSVNGEEGNAASMNAAGVVSDAEMNAQNVNGTATTPTPMSTAATAAAVATTTTDVPGASMSTNADEYAYATMPVDIVEANVNEALRKYNLTESSPITDHGETAAGVSSTTTTGVISAAANATADIGATTRPVVKKEYSKNIAGQLDKVLDAEFGENGEEELEKEANEGRETFKDGVEHGEKVGVVVRVGGGGGNVGGSGSTGVGSTGFASDASKTLYAHSLASTFHFYDMLKSMRWNTNHRMEEGKLTDEEGAARLLDENNDEYVVSRPRSRSFELQVDVALVRDLMIVMVSTTTCGLIAYSLSQPPISGFLIGGSIVGPGGLGIVNELVQVETVAQLGVIFLLMALGMEFKLQKIKGVRNVALLGGTLQILATIGICGFGAVVFQGNWKKGLFVGAFISMSSTTVVLQSITERAQMSSTFGCVTIGTLILQDIAVGILFALLPVLGKKGADVGDAIAIAWNIIIMLVSFVGLCWLVSKTFLNKLIGLVSSPGPVSLGLQHAFVAMMGLVTAVISDRMGLSLELGAFAAGVMVASTEHSSSMLHAMEPIRNVFVALFLGTVGMLISVKFLGQHIGLLLFSVIIVSLLKTMIIGGTVKAFGYPMRTSLGVGAAMAQIGEFSFVLLGRARELDIIEGSFYLLLLGSAALSLFSTPMVFKYMVWPIIGPGGSSFLGDTHSPKPLFRGGNGWLGGIFSRGGGHGGSALLGSRGGGGSSSGIELGNAKRRSSMLSDDAKLNGDEEEGHHPV